MTNREKFLSVLVVFFMTLSSVQVLDAGSLKSWLKDAVKSAAKAAGIVYLVEQFGPQLNEAANKALKDKSVPNVEATKVVPILTVGEGLDAGACQITGPAEKVAKVKMVYAINSKLDKGKKFEIQGLVPSTSMNPLKIDRVYGVGVVSMISYNTSK